MGKSNAETRIRKENDFVESLIPCNNYNIRNIEMLLAFVGASSPREKGPRNKRYTGTNDDAVYEFRETDNPFWMTYLGKSKQP